MRSIFNYIFIILISSLIAVLIFEIHANYRSDLYPSYGWQNNNVLNKKIEKCNENKNIGVFGDSFVEYFGNDKNNLVNILDKKFKNYNLCNFGKSGDSINHYNSRFLKVLKSDAKLDKAIFFIYEGNDFYEFRYLDYKNLENIKNNRLDDFVIKGDRIFDYSDKFILDRKLSFFKNIIKSTYTLNLIYREFIKKYIVTKDINEEFVQEIYSGDKYYEVDLNQAIIRMKQTPKKIKKLLSADILNINFYKLALRNPNYFNQIFNPNFKQFELQKNIAKKHINFINQKCLNYKIICKIVIIPADIFLFENAKIKYNKKFMFDNQKEFGKSKIVKFLTSYFDNVYYPKNILSYNDYIENDMHLNGNGNRKIANFVYNLF
jgi:hypothetical protein